MSLSLLLLGFLIGMRHAVEADHVAAVSSLATRAHSVRDTIRQGTAWGIGHTLTLFGIGTLVILLDTLVPERVATILELLVGIMLVGLGADVLRRLVRDRVHFHLHHHGDGTTHFHAHSHAGETAHDPSRHEHRHPSRLPLRALLVGLMHGMAGSAALILLTLQTVASPWTGLLYIALFGLGSTLGMALLSAAIALPLRYSARRVTWLHQGLQAAVGLTTIAIGARLVYLTGFAPPS
jgi:ABC-type nickel/cobalt efflux system permease component RcnA